MSVRNYCGEFHGPQPTPEEQLQESGLRSLVGIVCAPAVVVAALVALWLLR